ncbi:glycosyltransferase family 39 protein [Mesorhizobium sp. BH1-1-4]|uniref:glycosyltransferase family 39 protein n=1 Tax=Mesorhizobium sp. BH1-1-4 TaxID=2876662 RepID=UPI001CD0EF77|nr:glycosyltransferase family 39 protein [Mesorhizobium sp. BH1-1-4]MBZ9996027.1 glycosyltransferase family 39 protein [Mesorhizobium sp. BH1-1-4]
MNSTTNLAGENFLTRRVYIMIGCLVVLTVLAALWPIYRAFLDIEIDTNEGWNAYYADAAMGRMPLYPAAHQLIANNYPPLSFYIVGGLGRLIGDVVLAGRLLSLAAILVIAWGVFRAIRLLGGDATSAVIGALFFGATMCRFFTGYVGMDDPHLLAQAAMTIGFVAFLKARAQDRGYALPILLMVAAGFIKHNIVVMPLTAMIWVGINKPRQMVKSAILAAFAIVLGFALCYVAFGPDFFSNLRSPRAYSLKHAFGAIGHLQWIAVGLAAWVYVGITRRTDPNIRLCNLLNILGLVMFFVQKTGDGVAYNAQFELVFGVSIATGLAFAHAPLLPLARRWSPEALRFVLLLAICLRLVASSRIEPVRLLIDPSFHEEIAAREAAMSTTAARLKSVPGDATCFCTLASYRSGKTFIVDPFYVHQQVLAGLLPPDAIDKLVAAGKLTVVEADPLLHW